MNGKQLLIIDISLVPFLWTCPWPLTASHMGCWLRSVMLMDLNYPPVSFSQTILINANSVSRLARTKLMGNKYLVSASCPESLIIFLTFYVYVYHIVYRVIFHFIVYTLLALYICCTPCRILACWLMLSVLHTTLNKDSILFYSILFCSILFYSILFYSI